MGIVNSGILTKSRTRAAVLALTLLAACTRNVSFDAPFNLKEPRPAAKVKARIDPALLELKESSTEREGFGPRKTSYHIGKALDYFFEHDPSARVSISYVVSALEWRRIDKGMFAHDAFDAEYRIVVLVQPESEKRQVVEVKGSGSSLVSSVNACQEATESAVITLYRKVAPLTGLQLRAE
ncbi:MAG: hypothetical protein ACREQW_02465 [Candidatus Binatia bacterium]